MLTQILFLSMMAGASLAAMCGQSEYFEYKFKPIKAGPMKDDDAKDAHGRCGPLENRCDLMFFIYGRPKCKTGTGTGNGKELRGPRDKNVVMGSEFNPPKLDWAVHADWSLPKAFEIPFKVQLCDHDHGITEGSHDQLLTWDEQHLKEGCHTHTIDDSGTNAKHPWKMEFEVCCRPIAGAGFFRKGESEVRK